MNDENRLDELLELFLARRAKGRPTSPEEFCAEHPAEAAELRTVFLQAPSLAREELKSALKSLGDRTAPDQAPPRAPTTLVGGDPTEVPARTIPLGSGSAPETLVDGRYRIVRTLGEGGFGRVHLVQDTLDEGEERALKIILPIHSTRPEFGRRFRNEIRVLRALSHPGIPRIHNDGRTADGSFYYTMEFVQGRTLADVLKESGPLPPARVVAIVRQMIEVLDYAHAQGVVHRDLKPANIMLQEDGTAGERVRVLDFGIAKILTPEGPLQGALTMETMAGLGTPHYMAPEQVRGQGVDQRTDIYALGIIIYQMCSGLLPFSGASAQEIATARLEKPPKPLVAEQSPPWLRDLVMSLLAREKDDRPSTHEVLAKIEGLQRSQRSLRRWVQLTSGAVVLLALASSLYWSTSSDSGEPVLQARTDDVEKTIHKAPEQRNGGQAEASTDEDARGAVHAAPGIELDPGALVHDEAGDVWLTRSRVLDLTGRVIGAERLTIDGAAADPDADGRFSLQNHPLQLDEDGRGVVRLEASGEGGTATSKAYALVLDERPPLLDLIGVAGADWNGGAWLADESKVDLSLRITEQHPHSWKGIVRRLESGSSQQLEGEDLAPMIGVALDPGRNELEISARDLAGNVSQELRFVVHRRPYLRLGPATPGLEDLTWEGDVAVFAAATDSTVLEVRRSGDVVPATLARVEARTPSGGLDVRADVASEVLKLSCTLPRAGGEGRVALVPVDADGIEGPACELQMRRLAPPVPQGCSLVQDAPLDATSGWPTRVLHGRTGIELVLVPCETPFYIGRHEVTWDQYAAFADEASMRLSRWAKEFGSASDGDLGNHPVIDVSLAEAQEFCERTGTRLPTWDEWNLAATSGERTYPWGDEWLSGAAHTGGRSTGPVGTHPDDVSSCGALDLAGSVREWCFDPTNGEGLGGASWYSDSIPERTSVERSRISISRSDTIGFRVVLEARP